MLEINTHLMYTDIQCIKGTEWVMAKGVSKDFHLPTSIPTLSFLPFFRSESLHTHIYILTSNPRPSKCIFPLTTYGGEGGGGAHTSPIANFRQCPSLSLPKYCRPYHVVPRHFRPSALPILQWIIQSSLHCICLTSSKSSIHVDIYTAV